MQNINKYLDDKITALGKQATAVINAAVQKRLGGGTPVAPPVVSPPENKPADTDLHNGGWNGWTPEHLKGFKIQQAAPSQIELDAAGKVTVTKPKQPEYQPEYKRRTF